MNLKDQNSKNRVVIYSTSKFWSVNNKEAFKETIADIFKVDALTAKKASAYLLKVFRFLKYSILNQQYLFHK